MLRHTGQKRSFVHNLRLAVLLCLNAGFINVAGLMAFSVLTTNLTGHAALLAKSLALSDFHLAWKMIAWIGLFLSGVFFTGLFIAATGRNKRYSYSLPIAFISVVLLIIAYTGNKYPPGAAIHAYFTGSLLFSMGMQNAMVSMISGSVVRTTHLTGMFTDLGIDLATAVLKMSSLPRILKRRIILRVVIVLSFLAGGIMGGLCFSAISYTAFYIPVFLLLATLFYDYFRIKIGKAVHRYYK